MSKLTSIQLNLLAETLLKETNGSNNKIQLCNTDNFLVVKGDIESDSIFNVSKSVSTISETKEEFKITNTIDLLDYNSANKTKEYEFIFYNTANLLPFYENNSDYFKVSQFPWGYGWNQGKLLYFYFKHIVYNIPPTYPFTWIKFNVTENEGVVDFTVEDDFINLGDKLKSFILDTFNFNLSEFKEKIQKMDLEKMILNPFEDSEILKESVGLIIN